MIPPFGYGWVNAVRMKKNRAALKNRSLNRGKDLKFVQSKILELKQSAITSMRFITGG